MRPLPARKGQPRTVARLRCPRARQCDRLQRAGLLPRHHRKTGNTVRRVWVDGVSGKPVAGEDEVKDHETGDDHDLLVEEDEKRDNWLLIDGDDVAARSDGGILETAPRPGSSTARMPWPYGCGLPGPDGS